MSSAPSLLLVADTFVQLKEELLSHAAALQTARQDALQQGELRLQAQRQLERAEGGRRHTQAQVEQLEREKQAWEAQRNSLTSELTHVRDEVVGTLSDTGAHLALVPVRGAPGVGVAGTQPSPAVAVLQSQVRELQACADELQRQLTDSQSARIADANAHAAHVRELQLEHTQDSAQLRAALAQLKSTRDSSVSGLGPGSQAALAELHARLDSSEEGCRSLQLQLAGVRQERDEAVAKAAGLTATHAEEAARLHDELLTAVSAREASERACLLADARAQGYQEEGRRLRAQLAQAEAALREQQAQSSFMPSLLQQEVQIVRSELSEERSARDKERHSSQAQLVEQGQAVARLQAQVSSTEQACSLRVAEAERRAAAERARCEELSGRIVELEGQVGSLMHDIAAALAQGGGAGVGVGGPVLDMSRTDTSMLDVSRSGPRRSSLSAVLQAHTVGAPGMRVGAGVMPLSAVKPGKAHQHSALLSASYVAGSDRAGGLGFGLDVSQVSALARAVVRVEDEQAASMAQSQTQAFVAQGEAAALRHTCNDLREQLSSTQTELTRAHQQLNEARRAGERAARLAQEAETRAAVATAQSRHTEEALEEARNRCRALEDREVSLRATVLSFQHGAGAAVAQETAGLQHDLQSMEEELEGARAELATARAKSSKYKSQLLQLYELHKEVKAALLAAQSARAQAERAHQ